MDYPRHKLLNKKCRQRSETSDLFVDARVAASTTEEHTHKALLLENVTCRVGKIARIMRYDIRDASGFLISRRLIPQQGVRGGKRDSRRETRRRAVASVQSAVRRMRNVRMRIRFALICVCMRMATCGRAPVAVVIERGIRWTDIFPFRFQRPPHIFPAFHHLPIGFALRLDSARIVKTERRNPMANICSPNIAIFSRNSRCACTLLPLAEYGVLKIIER